MFDYVQTHVAPGARVEDTHHYGVRVYNPALREGRLKLYIGSVTVEMLLPPTAVVTVNDEESQYIAVENLSDQWMEAEWKKTRD